MRIAESLYMAGLISYPRVDNTVYPATLDLGAVGSDLAKINPALAPVCKKVLAGPMKPTRGKVETTDHPPIYPTGEGDPSTLDGGQRKLYDLIARRFLATLMGPATIENTKLELDVNGEPFVASGDVLVTPGFREAYPYGLKRDEQMPPLEQGDTVDVFDIKLEAKQTEPPARYSQGKLIQEIVEEHSAVIFNGDGYSEIWHQEAERRGLPNYRTTPEALMVYTSPDVVDLYSRYNVLSRQELKARQEIYIEQYCKTIRAEANLVIRMGRTIIYPAGLRFQQELLRACLDMRALNREPDTVLLDDIDDTLRKLREGLEHLENNVDMKIEDPVQEAHHKCTVVIPAMNAIRTLADHLETIVPEDLWPLPSYQEMLFVK